MVKRLGLKAVNYIRAMAEYFGRNCTAEFQKAALRAAIKNSSWIQLQEMNTVEELIYKWLREEEDADRSDSIGKLINGVSHFQFKKPDPAAPFDLDKLHRKNISEVEVFYCTEGKQNAVLIFLSLVLQSKNPQTLLLYSDEDMGWLTGNREFTLKWSSMLNQVIKRGNKIKIIHTVDRGFDEMLSAIREWVPLYMTGSIEPYYYPRIRDGLFRRTLFIAPDTAAISSGTVGSGTKNAANFLFTNKMTIKALIEEYNDLLSRCRMLMRIFTPHSNDDYLSLLSEFEDEKKDSIIKTDILTNVTMPLGVMESILARTENPGSNHLLSYQQNRIKKFLAGLQKKTVLPKSSLSRTRKIY